ncbi:BTAD domain-containing putative transcriptional regulator [Actinosynnema sp. NPDC002837]
MGDLSVGVLGPLEVLVDGERQRLGGHRQERLLALLLINANSSMALTQVIDALWGDGPPATARNQVYNTVARLRRELGDARAAVVTDGQSYRLDIAEEQVDFMRFSRSVDRARRFAREDAPADAVESLRAGLALWRGSALDGMHGPAFDHAAAKLTEERLAASELLVQLRLDSGDTTGLIAELTALTGEHPERETLLGQLMTVLYHEGRQIEALRTYEQARVRFADELGVDAGPELRLLHERILRNDPTLVPRRPAPVAAKQRVAKPQSTAPPIGEPRFLPRDIADFTGRDDEVGRLISLVEESADTAVVITALDGMPGVGKTTLAVRVGHLMADRFPQGQMFVDLHGYTPGRRPLTPAGALDLLLRGAGVPPEQIPDGLERRADLWRSTLADRRMLVVLDNAVDTPQVRPLLPGSAGVRVLVTSRRRLSMLEGASSLSVDLLPPEDAVRLFHRVATPERVGDASSHVAEVVALCGFLPLAIRIAASRLRNRPLWSVAHLADLLRDEDNRLAELTAGDRSVGAAFAVSYQNLPKATRRSFRLLGLLPGSDFDEHGAAAAIGSTVPEARRLLEDLIDANLLGQHAPGRYHFHDLLRQYARTMSDPDERSSAISRTVAHYLELGHFAGQVVDPGRTADAATHPASSLPDLRTAEQVRAVIAAEHRNVVAVMELASAEGLRDEAARLATAFGPLLQRQGYLDEALAGYEMGLQAATSREAEAALHRSVGLALITARRLDAALRAFRASLAIEEELGNEHGTGRVHVNIGIVHIRAGRYSDALTHLNHSLDLLRDVGTKRDKAAVLVNLGVAHVRLGNHAEAIAHNEQALAENAELGNPHVEATALVNLGHARWRSGEVTEALRVLARARELCHRIGATEMEARSLYTTAGCLRGRNPAEALAHGRAALVLAREIGNRDVQSQALVILGQIHLDLGALAVAAECFHEALHLTANDGDNYVELQAHEGLALIARAEDDPGRARHHWRVALAHAESARLPEADRIRGELTGEQTG